MEQLLVEESEIFTVNDVLLLGSTTTGRTGGSEDDLLREDVVSAAAVQHDGGRTNDTTNIGNQRFLQLLRSRLSDYANKSRVERPIVAAELLKEWRAQIPPGRFVKLVDNGGGKGPGWKDIGDKKAREKISKALKSLVVQLPSSSPPQIEDGATTTTSRLDTNPTKNDDADVNSKNSEAFSNMLNPSTTVMQKLVPASIIAPAPPSSTTHINNRNMATQHNTPPNSVLVTGTAATPSSLRSMRQQPERRISEVLDHTSSDNIKLYGRQKEQEILIELYRQRKQQTTISEGSSNSTATISGGSITSQSGGGQSRIAQFCLISGEHGKSALAYSLKPMMKRDQGYLVHYKFHPMDTYFTNTYTCIITMLNDFISQLLPLPLSSMMMDNNNSNNSNNSRKRHVECIRTAMIMMFDKKDIYMIMKIVPRLGLLLSSDTKDNTPAGITYECEPSGIMFQPTVSEVIYVFRLLLRCMAYLDTPCVLLLDDLHYACDSTLDMLATLISDLDIHHRLLMIGTCNGKNIDKTTSFTKFIDRLQMDNVHITTIELKHLSQDAIYEMLADSLILPEHDLNRLSHVIETQTGGDILFIKWLLQKLQDEELLSYNEFTKRWQCDSHMINFTLEIDTVFELLRSRVRDLPIEVQETLKYAACLVPTIQKSLLSFILPTVDVQSHLSKATTKGFLIVADRFGENFEFANSVIHQVASSLISPCELESYHARIGRMLWNNLYGDMLEKNLYLTIRHLISAGSSISTDQEKYAVSALCLKAAKQTANNEFAFHAASLYIQHGISMLGIRKWRDNYELSLQLHNKGAEIWYSIGDLINMERVVNEVMLNTRSLEDSLTVRTVRISALGSVGRYQEASELGLTTLKKLGHKIPVTMSKSRLAFSVGVTRKRVMGYSEDKLLRLPLMRNSNDLMAMQILDMISSFVDSISSTLGDLITLRIVDMTLRRGVCATSCLGFTRFGALLCSCGVNISDGYRLGKLGLRLYEEFRSQEWIARFSASFYCGVATWREPFQTIWDPLRSAYQTGITTSDVEYCMVNASVYFWRSFECMTLYESESEISKVSERLKFLGRHSSLGVLLPLWQMMKNCMGTGTDPASLRGEVWDQESAIDLAIQSNPALVGWESFFCLVTAYLFSDYDLAEIHSVQAAKILNYVGGMDASAFIVYECLTLLAQTKRGKPSRIPVVQRRLVMLRRWATYAPENTFGRLYLVEGELAAVMGDHMGALSKYKASIMHSRDHGLLLQQALGNERMGKYYMDKGETSSATAFLEESYRLYERWGGIGKKVHLIEEMGKNHHHHNQSSKNRVSTP